MEMSKVVVIHQPDFMPHLGFFHRLLLADQFIVLDHVQFVTGTSRSWTHRDKIKTSFGEKWLSLSIRKAPMGTLIKEIELSSSVDWVTNNLNLLKQNYSKAPFFDEIFPFITTLYDKPPIYMVDFNLRSIKLIMDLLDIKLPILRSSSLQPNGSSNDLLICLLRKVHATTYLSGCGARAYMQLEKFAQAGIEVVWQNFIHPVYPQQFGNFAPNLSTLDLLFNCGIASSRQILRKAV